MTDVEQRVAAANFAAQWQGRGDEKQETQSFWIALLQKLFGVEDPTQFIEFEVPVKLDHTSFIDGYISSTRVLIEQKGKDISLRKGYKQSDGNVLTPFQQARRYAGYLPFNQVPRWIVVSNFQEFHVHDMNRPNDEPEIIQLANLGKEYPRLQFLVDTGSEHIKKEMEVSLQAGELVGALYDALLKQYKDPEDPEALKSLNKLCVRLVFCLYAEDANLFGGRNQFHDYLEQHRSEDRRALINLFRVLNQQPEERDKYLDDDLAAFPYVNGGLFADEDIEIPRLGEEVIDLILHRASEDFDWSAISPTIFGAVFESTLNPETRRSGGMHYTSIENIHKLIDPLFFDELKLELTNIETIPVEKTRKSKLEEFQRKLAGIKFLDPACGSGNFLTETYISLRRLENQVIDALQHGQVSLGGVTNPIQVSIGQFYGIEINDFAVTVAKTALWIAESQMMKETEDIVRHNIEFLPLKTYATIVEGDALQLDWEEIISKYDLDYIMGNPPFSGGMKMSAEKKAALKGAIGENVNGVGEMDYVAGWYYLAAKYIQGTAIECAFVSTNSITQGQQAITVWEPLVKEYRISINFAYRTFKWKSESAKVAAVHCVIVGFSQYSRKERLIIDAAGNRHPVSNINSYLVAADHWFVHAVSSPLCAVPSIRFGSMPRGKAFIMSVEERNDIVRQYPNVEKYIKKFYMGNEFIKGEERYCLWLIGADPVELKKCPPILERLEQIKKAREESPALATRRLAETPTLFAQIAQPDMDYIAVPAVSTQRRKYIPIGFLSKDIIAGNKLYIIPEATTYHFGILTSNVHMAWMRMFAGRMKSDYSYSKDIVYNNFPWPTPTDAQKAKIEQTAQAIIDARALYPNSSLADLYDETTMPPELRKAHQDNDRAVMRAYGFSITGMTESMCVAELMKMYQRLVAGQ